jgi:hypothetical protein
LLVLFCVLTLTACSGSKTVRKPTQSSIETALVSAREDEVIKKLGMPSLVSKTNEGHILWVYEPPWKIMPNDKGTVYVEFDKERVIKVFRKR